ncbi:Tyrocidine synthase 3 [Paraglaciecola mesophila]|uniref:Tyrocidine synthase 3 n=1 Tax=Paraglaciecola mesophila TaxID=197222 RepID=A0A857JL73_9ALTE|nr:AMP-binding protein [Paraglaciecola mesophila]QHJ12082.1 Tyrocidine synthase 3 [Paraglaciecola mesophila]
MSSPLSLSNWMVSQPDCIVAVSRTEALTSGMFVAKVSSWRRTLSQHAGRRWVVYHSNPYEFLAIIYALWYEQKLPCIPGDDRPATLKRLSHQVDGFIGELSNAIQPVDKCPFATERLYNWQALSPQQIAVELYTSGSSGTPKAIIKTLAQLDNEILSLQSQWPAQVGAVVLSTVSHQHLYGLIFRLLRPFCAGQPIYCDISEYTEDVYNVASTLDSFVLVSSPSHISRINTLLDWKLIAKQCVNIFSAAAPLEKADAVRLSGLLNAPLWEIYGSSETGVIAWRNQSKDTHSDLWQLLPSVTFTYAENEQVQVTSSFTEEGALTMLNDHIDFHSQGRFALKGRLDTIVKIEGKRVSLTAIETLLMAHTWIKACKALVVTRKRSEIAIVLAFNTQGEQALMLQGRKSIINGLREFLSPDLESIVMPRRWRFVDALPYNPQGKLPLASLEKIVDKAPVLKWPIVKSLERVENTLTIQCHIPPEIRYFNGHFDNTPILPGVVQVHWAHKLAKAHFAELNHFYRLEVIKFSQVIQPNENVEIQLTFNSLKQQVTFSFQSEKGIHSSGRICFE